MTQILIDAKTAKKRRESLEIYIANDLLCLKCTPGLSKFLLCHPHPQIRECFAILLNVISTDCTGRNLLVEGNNDLVADIIHGLKLEKRESECRKNILLALQKLSIRRKAQSKMNDLFLVSHLCDLLADLDGISDQTAETCASIMMNLLMRSSARLVCAENPGEILHVLNNLLELDNDKIKTYVNGSLFSLFADSTIREQAHSIGLEEQLKYMKQFTGEHQGRQIDFVIEKLNTGISI